MQYMLLIYSDEQKWANLSEAERASVYGEYMQFTQAIVKSGHFRSGSQLQPAATATTVRARGEKRVTTDGPFAEAKEQLGGYYLLECANLDEALAIAGRIPGLRVGDSIEVRPLVPRPQPA